MPATAEPIEPTGEWDYQQDAETCRASRTFGHDADRVILQLRTFGPNSPIELTLARADLPKEPWSARVVEMGWDGEELASNQFGVLASIGGLPSVTLLAVDRPASVFFKGQVDTPLRTGMPLETDAQTLQIRVVGTSAIDLSIGSLSETVTRLLECDDGLLEQWGWGSDYQQRIASGPELIDRANVSPTIAYPAPMVEHRISNFAEFRLKIDVTGKVAECVVQSSPASLRFGEDSCKTMRRKIRYAPARDQQGQAVESYAQMAIAFGVIF